MFSGLTPEEQRARADLEALVETCPVGVLVLDAATGAPLSLNREARRILARIEATETSPAVLRDAVVCQRGDGREVRLGDLGNAETVRAEEVEISAPGGRSVRALIDAIPVRAAGGAVERVAGGVATCETLIRRVWGGRGGGNVEALRSDDARKPRYVIGVRGLGYRMPEPAEE